MHKKQNHHPKPQLTNTELRAEIFRKPLNSGRGPGPPPILQKKVLYIKKYALCFPSHHVTCKAKVKKIKRYALYRSLINFPG